MSNSYVFSNFGGRQPNSTAYVKNFVDGSPIGLWQAVNYNLPDGTTVGAIIPTLNTNQNVVVPGNLYVEGSIINPSDIYLKTNIQDINDELTNKIMNLKPSEFILKNDVSKKKHYGFIAQDFEKELPELVSIKPDKNVANLKSINYLEMIPLLVSKLQLMQIEIDELKKEIQKQKE